MGFFSSLFNSLFSTSNPTTNIASVSNISSTDEFDNSTSYINYHRLIYSRLPDCNLNYSDYTFSGKYTQTGKMRTKRHIQIFEGDDVLSCILNLGYEQPITYSRDIPASPSTEQMKYLRDLAIERGESVPHTLSSSDASALISRYVDHDSIPNPELFQYAKEMRMGVSYYAGKRMLYDVIFAHLTAADRAAFFIFCIYRDFNHSITANLNRCSYKELFYAFSDSVKADAKFQKSLNDNYFGADLRFFGSKYFKELGYSSTGGSKRTYAYKYAKEFLVNHHLVSNT